MSIKAVSLEKGSVGYIQTVNSKDSDKPAVIQSDIGYLYIGRDKLKYAFKRAQNAQIQIILPIHKVSSRPLLSIYTFCIIQ